MFGQALLMATTSAATSVTDTTIEIGSGSSTSANVSTLTINTANIGTPGPNRWVVVVWASALQSVTNTTTFTVDGVSPDYSDGQFNSGNGAAGIGIWKLAEGSTADVVVTLNTSSGGMAVQVYAFQSSAVDPRHETHGSVASTKSTNLDVVEGGAVFAAIGMRGGNADNSWTGVTEGEEVDANTKEWCSTGGIGSLSAQVNRTISYSSAVSNGCAFVAWSVKPN